MFEVSVLVTFTSDEPFELVANSFAVVVFDLLVATFFFVEEEFTSALFSFLPVNSSLSLLTEDELEATTYGRRVKAKEDIKAVTHHGLEVKQTNNGWEATIIFDI